MSIPKLRQVLHGWQHASWAHPDPEQREAAKRLVKRLDDYLRSLGYTWLDVKGRDYVIAIGTVRFSRLDYAFCNGYEPSMVRHYPSGTSIYEILVDLKCFESRGGAKKNWKRTPGRLPSGYTEVERVTSRPSKWVQQRINITVVSE